MASAPVIPTARLASGSLMPLLGLGTWKAGTGEVTAAVKHALASGYTHLDCAADYANQGEVGAGIAAAVADHGVKREDIWVTSKLWNTDHAREHVRPACEQTLKELGLAYLDLYLIHFPIPCEFTPGSHSDVPRDESGKVKFARVPLRETWEAMEELVDAGLVKNIGVSNMSSQLMMDLLTYARIPPAVNQVELHPYLAQERLLAFCAAHNIHVTAFSPLGKPSYDSIGMGRGAKNLLELDVIKGIADKHSASPGQVLIKWAIQRGTSVIPKSANPDRIVQNLRSVDVTLDDEDLAAISGLDMRLRFNDPIDFWGVDIWAGGH